MVYDELVLSLACSGMLDAILSELLGIAVTFFGFSCDLSGDSAHLMRFAAAKLAELLLHFTNDVLQRTPNLIFVHGFFPSLKLADGNSVAQCALARQQSVRQRTFIRAAGVALNDVHGLSSIIKQHFQAHTERASGLVVSQLRKM
jgi:hypothetical protein